MRKPSPEDSVSWRWWRPLVTRRGEQSHPARAHVGRVDPHGRPGSPRRPLAGILAEHRRRVDSARLLRQPLRSTRRRPTTAEDHGADDVPAPRVRSARSCRHPVGDRVRAPGRRGPGPVPPVRARRPRRRPVRRGPTRSPRARKPPVQAPRAWGPRAEPWLPTRRHRAEPRASPESRARSPRAEPWLPTRRHRAEPRGRYRSMPPQHTAARRRPQAQGVHDGAAQEQHPGDQQPVPVDAGRAQRGGEPEGVLAALGDRGEVDEPQHRRPQDRHPHVVDRRDQRGTAREDPPSCPAGDHQRLVGEGVERVEHQVVGEHGADEPDQQREVLRARVDERDDVPDQGEAAHHGQQVQRVLAVEVAPEAQRGPHHAAFRRKSMDETHLVLWTPGSAGTITRAG